MENKKALLVIDVVNGIFNLPVPLFEQELFLNKVQNLVENSRKKGVPIIFIQVNGPQGSPFEKGTDGWRIHPRLDPQEHDIIIEKENPDAFQNTLLDGKLEEIGISELVVCGFATEGCVDATVRSAYARGYKVTLIADAHTTTDNPILKGDQIVSHHNFVLQRFSTVKALAEITHA